MKDFTDDMINKNALEGSLLIIDEVHNIRMTDDNKEKKVAVELEKLIDNVPDLRLLFLSATPMYNSYKESIWLINLMNKNDGRDTMEVKDVFEGDGTFKGEDDGTDGTIQPFAIIVSAGGNT